MDPYAVRIETSDGQKLGYVPGVHAQVVSTMLKNNISLTLSVKKVQPTIAPQWWLQVTLKGNLNMNQKNIFTENNLDDLIYRVA
ncbi:HIRAN domain-containing protein [Oceanobacillus halotolerans]|uniref:HIRAN domain-containing protein n=1 Tax=Oceanobacillus halotolerans TaxID=2663380 RepID=UPI00384BA115